MNALSLQAALRPAGVLLVDPRLLRRVIKAHTGLGAVQVPHQRCYGLSREELFRVTEPAELAPSLGCASPADVPAALHALPAEIVLLAQPSPRELRRGEPDLGLRLWREIFHVRVHLELARARANGRLDDAALRARIDRVGQAEFDEVRSILRHDDLVLPPAGDWEVYLEFAALYLELRHFAPALLVTTFPGIDGEAADGALTLDLDVRALLDSGRPPGASLPEPAPAPKTTVASFSAPAFSGLESPRAKPISPRAFDKRFRQADKATKKGNDVRAALLHAAAGAIPDDAKKKQAEAALRDDLVRLERRLEAALCPPGADPSTVSGADWASLLAIVADRAAASGSNFSVEARLLYALQRAAITHERPQRTVDVASWAVSRGRRPAVRPLPATRELRVARDLDEAVAKVRQVRIADADRKLLRRLMSWATERAEHNVRLALRPRLVRVLDEVGIRSSDIGEDLARHKLLEELLDEVVERGFITIGSVRDALSRNQLKLDDLESAGELWHGDPLLAADKRLADELDGIYRRGDVYLRGLQKASSLPFGTRFGRLLTLYLVLPVGAAYVVLYFIGLILSPIGRALRLGPVEPITFVSLMITSIVIFALIHSRAFRAAAREVLDVLVLVLVWVFFRLPRALLSRPAVRRLLETRAVRFTLRRVLVPLGFATAIAHLTPLSRYRHELPLAFFPGVVALFVAGSFIMGSRIGAWLEEMFFEQLAPAWQTVSRQILPGLFRLIVRFFTALLDLVQRAMYRVDELLRFREGQSSVMLVLKGTVGLVWGLIAYLVRLYVVLLVEPFTNPLKHFPTVTVADKVMLPFMPAMTEALARWLSPFGAIFAGAFAGVTVFLLPSVFGFLAWELKENWKLYRASRAESLPPVLFGPAGETMRGLLVPGLHSGTLPKLHARLRRAAQREDEQLVHATPEKRRARAEGSLGRFREGIALCERGVRRFVERELLALLARLPRWRHGPLELVGIDVSSNRVRLRLRCAALSAEPCCITFEEQSGYVVAGVGEPGFVAHLADEDSRVIFENALGGLYQMAEVDLVREQIANEVGGDTHYDIADEGLVVWSGDYRTELVYKLGGRARPALLPAVRGAPPESAPRPIDARALRFREQAIAWVAWVAAWSAAQQATAAIPRLVRGAPLLPRSGRTPQPAPVALDAPAAIQ